MNDPADIKHGVVYNKPNLLDTSVPVSLIEDDKGLPPLMRDLLDETDPPWSPALNAFTVQRYFEPVQPILEPLPVEPVRRPPPQPQWAEAMERKATEDDEVTQHLKIIDQAVEDDLRRGHNRWWPFKKR